MTTGDSALTKFGNNLRSYRSAAGISQEELAEKVDLDRTYISLLERGQRNPSLQCMLNLSQALNIPLSKLCEAL